MEIDIYYTWNILEYSQAMYKNEMTPKGLYKCVRSLRWVREINNTKIINRGYDVWVWLRPLGSTRVQEFISYKQAKRKSIRTIRPQSFDMHLLFAKAFTRTLFYIPQKYKKTRVDKSVRVKWKYTSNLKVVPKGYSINTGIEEK